MGRTSGTGAALGSVQSRLALHTFKIPVLEDKPLGMNRCFELHGLCSLSNHVTKRTLEQTALFIKRAILKLKICKPDQSFSERKSLVCSQCPQKVTRTLNHQDRVWCSNLIMWVAISVKMLLNVTRSMLECTLSVISLN